MSKRDAPVKLCRPTPSRGENSRFDRGGQFREGLLRRPRSGRRRGVDDPEFKLEGIKKFSIFSGLCGGHDKAIFQPIEDVAFTATAKQKYIYAYRAAAKELHSNLESKRLCEVQLGDKLGIDDFPAHFQATLPLILKGLMEVPPFMKEAMLQGAANHRIRVRHKQCETTLPT
ncbi:MULTISPECIES: hypothetical protein [Paraburkholderia]|uniref:hypothetical protein n=1 Tax=Paraburkholderia TaxID=1822464 RepID=UPI003218216B